MNASVRTRDTLLSLWEASVEQTLSLCHVSALKRRQTLWEYADVTPAVAHSQTRCRLIDSWMIREPTTLMHTKGHLMLVTAAACVWGRAKRRHPSICVTSLLILCSWTLHHPALPKTSHAETPRIGDQLRAVQRKRHDLVFREVPPHSANLNVNHLLSLPGPWKLLIFRKHSVCSLLKENSSVFFFSGCSESTYSGHHLVFCNSLWKAVELLL